MGGPMSHYKTNMRDIEFNLFEVLGRDEVLGQGPFEAIDGETARSILGEVERLAREDLAASYEDSDRNPPVFDPATHTAPGARELQEELRGLARRGVLAAAAQRGARRHPRPREPDLGPGRDGARRQRPDLDVRRRPGVRGHRAPQRQRPRQADRPAHRRPPAGTPRWCSPSPTPAPTSAPAAPRPRPTRTAPGTSPGVKRFITSAESDLTENIIHLVLARPVGVEGVGGPGTKGLSLFIVPKIHFDVETGELTGERNGAYVTNVEHKMGIKVSNTCEVTFGDPAVGGGEPARGYLLGEVHNGIAQMFQVIENARMMVGSKAIATLSTGYLNALEYAKTRVQGADLTRAADKTAPARHDHPPPRRTPLADGAEVLLRGDALAGALHRLVAGPGADGRAPRRDRRAGDAGQRPAAADRQGLRLGALVGAAGHRVAADLRRVGLPAGVPHRAVRPRRQDRHPLRGHHRDPGPGLLLPQDRQGPGAGAGPPGRRDRGLPGERGRQRPPQDRARAAGARSLQDAQASSG